MDAMNTALSVIMSRKSVRNFIPGKEISKADLETILKAGMAAPSGVNAQPWAYLVVTERLKMDNLSEKLPYAKMLTQASAAIIVCGDMSKALDGKAQELWINDCSMSAQNILLAVEALGLGATYTAVFPDDDRSKLVSETFNLPDNIKPLCVIPIGYPAHNEAPKDKWKPENIHWNKW